MSVFCLQLNMIYFCYRLLNVFKIILILLVFKVEVMNIFVEFGLPLHFGQHSEIKIRENKQNIKNVVKDFIFKN